MPSTSKPPNNIIIIGRFAAPFGVKGWLKVHSFTHPPDNIIRYQPWQVKLKQQWRPLDIETIQEHHHKLIAAIKNCHSPESAAQYKNADIGIYRHQLPLLEPNEVYWSDLENLNVVTEKGDFMGTVQSIFATGANEVLVVKSAAKKEILIPYVLKQVIKKVDLEQGIITVDWEIES